MVVLATTDFLVVLVEALQLVEDAIHPTIPLVMAVVVVVEQLAKDEEESKFHSVAKKERCLRRATLTLEVSSKNGVARSL
jgi:hypothetical protein